MDDVPPLWNPDGKGLRGPYGDQPFAQLEPATGSPKPVAPDEPLTQPSVNSGSTPASPMPDPSNETIDDIIIVFNGTAYYTTLFGVVTGPV
jgi:hypothetical protein